MTMRRKISSGIGLLPRTTFGRLVASMALLLASQFSSFGWAASLVAISAFQEQSTQAKEDRDPPVQVDEAAVSDKDRSDLLQSETDRQKEQRAAVEQERQARAGTTKTLKTKLAELELNPGKRLDLTFDDLVFDMEKGETFQPSMITKEINQIHNRKVSLSGYIRPSARQKGITKFVFVRDNKECCFGPGAALFDCVLVKMAEGKEVEYTVRPITIEGDFYLKEFKGPNGRCWAVYRMKNGEIK